MPLVSCDISVSIHSGGQELTPYGIETDEETNTAVGYIASTAGETFEIHVEDMNVPRVPIVITVYADGQHLRSTGVRPEGSPLIVIDMARISQVSLAPMSFSKYDLVDDPAISNEDTQNLGSVHIKVYQSKLIASSGPVKDPSQNEYAMADFSRVAETSKKAGGHRVVLNREKIIRSASGGSSVAGVDPTKTTPLGNFKFFYQPKDLLIAKGIMPRPPPIRNENECQNNQKRSLPTSPISENSGASSSALPRKRSRLSERLSHTPSEQPEEDVKPQIDGLQDDERDQRIQDLEAELNTLRAAARGKSGKVKRERLPSIRVGNADGEVIDLTGDD